MKSRKRLNGGGLFWWTRLDNLQLTLIAHLYLTLIEIVNEKSQFKT